MTNQLESRERYGEEKLFDLYDKPEPCVYCGKSSDIDDMGLIACYQCIKIKHPNVYRDIFPKFIPVDYA